VCIFGVVTNVLNFIVLTRKDLRTHINFILAALAVSDFLVMADYILYSVDYGLNIKSKYERLTFRYAYFIFTHAVFSQTAHTVSIFLTIMLALWRYIAVVHPNKKNIVMKQTIPAIIFSYIISPLISIPIYMSLTIKSRTVVSNETIIGNEINLTVYNVMPSELADKHEILYLWVYSVIIKLLPCIALTFLSFQLIHALYEAKKRKEKLVGNISIKLLKKKKQANRTTKMLIAVLLLFLITEFPQAVFGKNFCL
jgi:phosphate/sulfate permease